MERHDDERTPTELANDITAFIDNAPTDEYRRRRLELLARLFFGCATCNASGMCASCSGDGRTWQRDAGYSVECTACCGSGVCAECAGVGLVPPDDVQP